MTADRRNKRTSRVTKLDLESLGERIAPAVYHHGAFLNLVVEQHKPHHHREHKQERLETLHSSNKLAHSQSRFTNNLISLPMDKPTIVTTTPTSTSGTVGSAKPISLPMDKPTLVTTTSTGTTGTVGSANPISLPMDRPTLVATSSTNTSGTAGSANPISLPMDKPTIDTSTPTENSGPVVSTDKISLPMDRPTIAAPTDKPTIAPANVAQALNNLYQQYQQNPAAFTGSNSSTSGLLVQGDQVGVEVHDSNPDDFQNLVNELTNAGMTLTLSSATYGTAIGTLPISELITVAQFSNAVSINPEYAPVTK